MVYGEASFIIPIQSLTGLTDNTSLDGAVVDAQYVIHNHDHSQDSQRIDNA
jgi:hypothetical protein